MIEYTVKVYEDKTVWYRNGKIHRDDGPAVEFASGGVLWYKYGKRHRVDGPALINRDGTKMWFIEDQLHREDGPAIEYRDGGKVWYLRGMAFFKEDWENKLNPIKEMTVAELEKVLGHRVKIVK